MLGFLLLRGSRKQLSMSASDRRGVCQRRSQPPEGRAESRNATDPPDVNEAQRRGSFSQRGASGRCCEQRRREAEDGGALRRSTEPCRKVRACGPGPPRLAREPFFPDGRPGGRPGRKVTPFFAQGGQVHRTWPDARVLDTDTWLEPGSIGLTGSGSKTGQIATFWQIRVESGRKWPICSREPSLGTGLGVPRLSAP